MDPSYTDKDHERAHQSLENFVQDLLDEKTELFKDDMESIVRIIESPPPGTHLASNSGGLISHLLTSSQGDQLQVNEQSRVSSQENSHPAEAAPAAAEGKEGTLGWSRIRVDKEGRVVAVQAEPPVITGITLARSYLKNEEGLFWYKTWRCPEMLVTISDSAPSGGFVTLETATMSGSEKTLHPVPMRGETLMPVVTGSARFSGIVFDVTSFSVDGANMHFVLTFRSADGSLRDTWISDGIRVLSKRKRSRSSEAGESSSAGQPPPFLEEEQEGKVVLGRWGEEFAPASEDLLRTHGMLFTRVQREGLSTGVCRLRFIGRAVPPWLPRLACVEGSPCVAMTLSDVSAEDIFNVAQDPTSPQASQLKVCWCSSNMDHCIGLPLQRFIVGSKFVSASQLFHPQSLPLLIHALRWVAKVLLVEDDDDDQSGAEPNSASDAEPPHPHRVAVHCGPLKFRTNAPGPLAEVEMDSVIYFDPRARRLTLYGHFASVSPSSVADDQFRTICDQSLDLFKRVDEHGFVLYASAAASTLFGQEPWEHVGSATGARAPPSPPARLHPWEAHWRFTGVRIVPQASTCTRRTASSCLRRWALPGGHHFWGKPHPGTGPLKGAGQASPATNPRAPLCSARKDRRSRRCACGAWYATRRRGATGGLTLWPPSSGRTAS